MKKLLLFFSSILSLSCLTGQIPIGHFRTHLPYNGFHSVAASQDYVYAAAYSSIMLLEKQTEEMSHWSKVEGLSDVAITKIHFDKNSRTLIICYENGNLDFVRDQQITNVCDIKNKQIIGSKSVNHLYIQGESAYLCFSFGVVVINLKQYLIQDTWFTTLNDEKFSAQDFTILHNRCFLATDKGVFSIEVSDYRIADFSTWKKEEGLASADFNLIESFDDKVYVNRNGNYITLDSIFIYENDHWRYCEKITPYNTRSFDHTEKEFLVCDWDQVNVYNQEDSLVYHGEWIEVGIYEQAMEAILDGDKIWIADNANGLGYVNRTYYSWKIYTDAGPANNQVDGMSCASNVLAIVPGSHVGWGLNYTPPSFSFFSDEKWTYNKIDFTKYGNVYDITNVIVNPRNPQEFYLASWGYGLFKCNNGRITEHFDATNSIFESFNNLTFISGLAFDNYNNLWVTNSFVAGVLKVRKSDGSWKTFSLRPAIGGGEQIVAEQILCDSRNYKWITFPRSNDLIVFYDNNTIDNESDDKLIAIDMNYASEIASTTISAIAEDVNGRIWLGTEQGVKVISQPGNVFKGTAFPQNILLEQGGYVSVLLQFESITAIAVDGANRKWIGTSKAGVFLMSENGTEELLHFTTDNSPLLSNTIRNIAINHETGEVFFGTANGIISYRSNATFGKENYDEALVFPNPVREGYTGTIAVSGLKNNSFCKIADASGNLIWQGYANGGELIWNGKDYYGNRPATGVYFVFASDENGKEKKVAKILFIQ